MAFHHGITAKETSTGVRPIASAATSIIGLVAFAPAADESRYPQDTPVLLPGITQEDIDKAGTEGTLQKALKDISIITNPTVVVLVMSDPTNTAALDALAKSQSLLGVSPKIIGAPSMDVPDTTTKLVAVAKKLRSMVYASPRDAEGALLTELPAIQAYRDTFGDRELMLIDGGLKTVKADSADSSADDSDSNGSDSDAGAATIAVALGLRAHIDETYDAGITKSLSNVTIPGATGIDGPRTWDIEDPDTQAGFLNSHQVSTLIQYQGFRFWGNRTTSADPLFAFETVTRSAQFLLETIVDGCFPFIDMPMTPVLARDVIDTINAKLRALVSQNYFIGAECWYDATSNNPQDLSQGKLWVDYDYTPVPTLENLGLQQKITSRYLVDFSKLIAQTA